MMKRFLVSIMAISLIAASALTSGCANMKNRDVGTIAGGAVGAGVGYAASNSAVGTVAGAVVGGVAGHYIGKSTEK